MLDFAKWIDQFAPADPRPAVWVVGWPIQIQSY